MENIFTSGMATGIYLREHFPGKTVYPVGTEAFMRELESYGVRLGDRDAEVVCVGFDTELVYEKLERAVHFLRRGAAFVAANPDWVCPMPKDEVLPDCGSICALLTAATGVKPVFIGKPDRNMVDIISSQTGVPNDRICCVGDRLYTDIAVALNAGAVSVCVMSGETSPDMLKSSPQRPDYVLRDVKELADILKNRET
jgi:4-nitrophenyl phosphatase